jgi:hypothetical protein
MLFKVIPVGSSDQVHQKNSNSNWKKKLGFRKKLVKVNMYFASLSVVKSRTVLK